MSSWAELLKGKVAVVTGASRGLGRADAFPIQSVDRFLAWPRQSAD
ncbi:hypothetical protein NSQ51_12790 [Geobacillus sp. FSL K6-0789]|uniref:3-oxoacyl-(Acyl-carrier protein) reductase n=1 Tax=Geobacillus stearothermophilus TaxID=1422 RepID=A0ABQ7HEC5_GEOSE|nr:hypothetical protein [Geobacillus stearothermophilus]KAF6510487.1 3-oxoacyl-(acyl-carrier protein) reductase [Geobacillus stearothermophilus]OAO79683.1 3-oxoacyl-(acyl-carrier protein) reductase [Geobacillus stearothermophilus]